MKNVDINASKKIIEGKIQLRKV